MSGLYDKGRQAFLDGDIDWTNDTIKLALVDNTYAENLATHQYVTDLGAHIVARSPVLAGKTSTGGVADASDLVIGGVSGPTIEAYVVYQDTGTDATSRLIAYVDTATGLPMTPIGGSVGVTFDNGPNKIFKL